MQALPTNLASTGQRFFTFVLDIVFYLMCTALVGAFLVFSGLRQGTTEAGFEGIGLLAYLLYYFLQEAFDGKTLGKRIVGTRVVNADGGDISGGQALGRTFCRLIPFEALSHFGNDFKPVSWHDRISKTYVVINDSNKNVGRSQARSAPASSDNHPLNTYAKNLNHLPKSETQNATQAWLSEPLSAQATTTAQTSEATLGYGADELWGNAMAECNSGQRKAGLWARCFAETDGDVNKAQARYIKHRVAQEQQSILEEGQRIEDEMQVALLAAQEETRRNATQTIKDKALAHKISDNPNLLAYNQLSLDAVKQNRRLHS